MTIRFKLTTTLIAVIFVANAIFSFIALLYLSHIWMGEVQTRVRRNLNAARAAYYNHLEVTAALLRGTAQDRFLSPLLEEKDPKKLAAALHDLTGPEGMDFVAVLDPAGKVICRSGGKQIGDDLSADPWVASTLRDHKVAIGTVVLSRERLLTEGPELAQRAAIRVIPTEAAPPAKETARTDGMVAAVAMPVFSEKGRLEAVLYGGDLLNQRYEIVDAIKSQVFPDEVYETEPPPPVRRWVRGNIVSYGLKSFAHYLVI
jgi:two-component system, NtrC family, sensor kinase